MKGLNDERKKRINGRKHERTGQNGRVVGRNFNEGCNGGRMKDGRINGRKGGRMEG
jgi:hypothetical protein